MSATVTIPPSLIKSLEKRAVENYKKKIFPRMIKAMKVLNKEMIDEFMNHPVTKEILAGPRASNSSGTLEGYGNLFSFIGFRRSGDTTIEPILDIFKSIQPLLSSSANVIESSMENFPKPEEIWVVTPMPDQEGRSWAKGVESGISGLNYYLFSEDGARFSNSRSGTGVQERKPIRTHFRYKNTKYITALLKKYKELYRALNLSLMQSFNR